MADLKKSFNIISIAAAFPPREEPLQPLGIPDKVDVPVGKADELAVGKSRRLLGQHDHFLRVLCQ